MLNVNRSSSATWGQVPEVNPDASPPSAFPPAPAPAPASASIAGTPTQLANASVRVSEPIRPAAVRSIRATPPRSPIKTAVQSCNDAIRLISIHGGLPPLSSLKISVANDQELTLFAEAMRATQHPPIHLKLDRHAYNFTAAGLKALAPLKLRSLTIERAVFLPADYHSLANVVYPIALDLAEPKKYTQIIPGFGSNTIVERTPYLQSAISLHTLQVLNIHDQHVSDVELMAIKKHPNLRIVLVAAPVPKLFRALLANPIVTRLTVDGSELREAHLQDPQAFQGLRTHPALESLCVNFVDSPALLLEIAANAKIATLRMRVSPATDVAGIRDLAKMPALRDLHLRASTPNVALHQADISDLCQKPLQALRLDGFTMDSLAVASAVSARANYLLIIGERITFSSDDVNALCANKTVSCLILGGRILPADAARLAAIPTLTALALWQVPSNAAIAVKQVTEQAWVAARKPLSNLNIDVLQLDYSVLRA